MCWLNLYPWNLPATNMPNKTNNSSGLSLLKGWCMVYKRPCRILMKISLTVRVRAAIRKYLRLGKFSDSGSFSEVKFPHFGVLFCLWKVDLYTSNNIYMYVAIYRVIIILKFNMLLLFLLWWVCITHITYLLLKYISTLATLWWRVKAW